MTPPMTTPSEELKLRAIGTVRSEIKSPDHQERPDLVSEIIVDKALTAALDDIDDFSHIIILWWIHKSHRPAPMKVHPRGNPENKLTGVFATRSPARPNPIGESTVRLLGRRGNVLKVKGLDAIDGTPVLDIKPYIPGYDSVEAAAVPSWVRKK
jgi:tRNA-Thr(GGU) m(6)t(6)A37 methyltransferase TsaA